MAEPSEDIQKRDADTLKVLGVFFTIMGVLVLIGTFWAIGQIAAVIVSIISGGVLAGIGIAMWRYSISMQSHV